MDKETLEAFKGIVKEAIKEETQALEAAMQAQLEDVTGVIRDMGMMMEFKIDKLDSRIGNVEAKVDTLQAEVHAVKQTVERIDERTQNQVEALYEELRVTHRAVKAVQFDVARIKTHVGMPA